MPTRLDLDDESAAIVAAALDSGSFGCSISGSGPTIFAIADEANAAHCGARMQAALGDVPSDLNVVPIAQKGVRRA